MRELARKIIDYTDAGREMDLIDEIYSDDAVSVEPLDVGIGRVFKGKDAIRDKKLWIKKNFELHQMRIEGPHFHGDDSFVLIFRADTTDTMLKERDTVTIIGQYLVSGGKIVREQFFL